MELIEIEKLFDDFLLYDIEIIINNKVLKSGKLKMVSTKNHNIKFYIETINGIKSIELYYPFDYKVKKNEIIFDYDVSKLTKNDIVTTKLIETFPSDCISRFLNEKIIFKKL